MKTVSVSELKARFSQYLREVRRGGEVQILDRGVPVARLMPLRGSSAEGDGHRERLIRAGILRQGTGDASEVVDTPPLDLPVSLLAALAEEREDRL
jgi:prevent-host-death family protein